MIPRIFGLKGMAIAGAIGFAAGSYAAYRITDAFGDAAVLRLEKAADAKTIADQAATIADRENKLRVYSTLSTSISATAQGVNDIVATILKDQVDAEPAALAEAAAVCRDDPANGSAVRNRIARAAAAFHRGAAAGSPAR